MSEKLKLALIALAITMATFFACKYLRLYAEECKDRGGFYFDGKCL